MRKYPAENWKRLGTWVHDARLRAGYSDIKDWAARVSRSPRMMQGLERGEPVGPKTLKGVAQALGVGMDVLIDTLSDEERGVPVGPRPTMDELLAEIERLKLLLGVTEGESVHLSLTDDAEAVKARDPNTHQ